VEVRAVEAAIDVRQLVVEVADREVAPQAVARAVARLDVELAEGRSGLLHDRVVAEGRHRVVRVDRRNRESGDLSRKFLNRSSIGPSRVSALAVRCQFSDTLPFT
jgi:hypothetical protein